MTTPKSVPVLKLGPGGDFLETWVEDREHPGKMFRLESEPIRLKLVELPEAQTWPVPGLQRWLAWLDFRFWRKGP